MDLEVLKKKLSTYRGEGGRIRGVGDDLLLEILTAWEQWTGPAKHFYKAIGCSQKGMASMIGKAKKLKREGHSLPFEEVQEPIIDNQESNDELILNDNISDFSPEEKILESSSSTDNEKELTTILPKQKAKPIKDVLDDDEENQMTLF